MPRRLQALAATAVPLAAAAASAKPQLQTFSQRTFTSTAHQHKVFDKYAKVWWQPKETPALGKKAVVRATIGRDGKLVSAVVALASGSKAWDDAALAAVKKAAPFDPLPAEVGSTPLEVDLHLPWVK